MKKPLFTDKRGTKVSFKWWIKNRIANWHWNKFLRYEGLRDNETPIRTERQPGRFIVYFRTEK